MSPTPRTDPIWHSLCTHTEMNALPSEILSYTLSFLDTSTRYNAALVCKEWNLLLDTGEVSLSQYLSQCARDANISYLAPHKESWGAILTCETVEGNHGLASLECLQYLYDSGIDCYGQGSVTMTATRVGNLECLVYINERYSTLANHKDCSAIISCAANHGKIECLKYAFVCGQTTSSDFVVSAVTGGSLECARYLHEQGCHWPNTLSTVAIRNGSLDILQYIHQNELESKSQGRIWEQYIAAAETSNLVCLKYIQEVCDVSHSTWGEAVVAAAVSGKDDASSLLCLKYLLECTPPCPWDRRAVLAATGRGNIQCLCYLGEHSSTIAKPIGKGIMDRCAEHVCEHTHWESQPAHCALNRLLCLKYLNECPLPMRCEWDESTAECVAAWGNVTVLEYILNEGCSWDKRAILGATEHDSIECLCYLYERPDSSRCKWSSTLLIKAAGRGSIECLCYLVENLGHLWPECRRYVEIVNAAASCGDRRGPLECVKYLVENNFVYNKSSTNAAARAGNSTIMRYLIEQGSPWDRDTVNAAIASTSQACIMYLYELSRLQSTPSRPGY